MTEDVVQERTKGNENGPRPARSPCLWLGAIRRSLSSPQWFAIGCATFCQKRVGKRGGRATVCPACLPTPPPPNPAKPNPGVSIVRGEEMADTVERSRILLWLSVGCVRLGGKWNATLASQQHCSILGSGWLIVGMEGDCRTSLSFSLPSFLVSCFILISLFSFGWLVVLERVEVAHARSAADLLGRGRASRVVPLRGPGDGRRWPRPRCGRRS